MFYSVAGLTFFHLSRKNILNGDVCNIWGTCFLCVLAVGLKWCPNANIVEKVIYTCGRQCKQRQPFVEVAFVLVFRFYLISLSFQYYGDTYLSLKP